MNLPAIQFKKLLLKGGDLILDFLLPQSEEILALEKMSPALFLGTTHRAPTSPEVDLVLFEYRTPTVQTLIWEIKYRGNPKLVQLGAELLYDELLPTLEEERMWEGFTDPLLIPIPISAKRKRERGFNQCELLGEALRRLDCGTNFSYRADVLQKVKHTESQTASGREARLKNLQGCFGMKDRDAVRGKNIILLDDVVTTGATLHEAKRTLKAAGARRVYTVALAR